jgi:CHAD domain-containing protein
MLRAQWAGVRDGDSESVHQARVATRRLRAVLAVVDGAESDRIKLCKRLGRALGAVREADMAQDVFSTLATRLPSAAYAVAALRQLVEHDQMRARRRLAKTLDELKLRPLATLRPSPSPMTRGFWKDWRTAVASQLVSKRHALADALDHAPAVFMPNRVHRVRIAVKKLRYALEIADASGLWVDEDAALRDLRKTQDVLGRLHDVHVARRLIDHLETRGQAMADQVPILHAVMTADCISLHDKYLSRRGHLRTICQQNGATAIDARTGWPVRIAIGALPIAGGVAVWRLTAAQERPNA